MPKMDFGTQTIWYARKTERFLGVTLVKQTWFSSVNRREERWTLLQNHCIQNLFNLRFPSLYIDERQAVMVMAVAAASIGCVVCANEYCKTKETRQKHLQKYR